MGSLREIQKEQGEWAAANFDNRRAYQPILGATEEIGELAHAYLKMEQGIRGEKQRHLDGMKDAVGDCIVYLMDFCNQMDWDIEEVITDTWNHVKKRNWKKDSLQDTVIK